MVTGDALLLVAIIALATFLTWFSSRRRNVLLSMTAGLIWFSLAMRLFFSAVPPVGLVETHAQMLAWVFIMLTFLPLVFYMGVPIVRTRKGKTWTSFGEPPPDEEPQSEYEKYAQDLHSRMHPRKRKKKMW